MIECLTLRDEKKLVPKEKLNFRIGVYGIIVNDGKILLVNVRSTGKYFLPGGAVEMGETLTDALNREILEETGIEVEIKKFLMFGENFFIMIFWMRRISIIIVFMSASQKLLTY